MTSSQALLTTTLSDTTFLLESSTEASPSHNISSVFKKRLLAYYHHRNDNDSLRRVESISSGDEIELLTAQEALSVIQRVQAIVEVKVDNGHEEPPLLGTRDLTKLCTLLCVAVKWGLIPLYTRVSKVWIESSIGIGVEDGLDMASYDESYHRLSDLTTTFFSLVFPDGAEGRISQTLITSSILSRHVLDVLLPTVSLGWLPESMSRSSSPVIHTFRPLVLRFMKLLSASQAITALTGIISSTPPPHVRNACSSLLTKQVLRPDGVDGLCRAMFSEEESTGDEARLDKLEHIARILNSVPSSLEPQEYYSTICPRLLQVLTGSPQTSHKRAAAFAIYRSLLPNKVTKASTSATFTIYRLLHDPFLRPIEEPSISSSNQPRPALDAIVTLVGNAEPSPTFISKLLSPIILPLYALSYDLSNHRTVDPQLRESILGLLNSWAKIVDQFEGEQVLLLVIESGKNCDWMFDSEGNFQKVPRRRQAQPALLLSQNLKTAEASAEVYDMNLFESFPDPVHLVETLKAFDRGDIASSLFVKLFERYVAMKGQPDQDPMKVFHTLQIIVQMQQRLSEGTTSNILRRPDKLFPFIYRVLTSVNVEPINHKGDNLLEGDSDDEEEGLNTIGPDQDLIETTITLLLSVLEADETVSVAKYPILEDISFVLEPLALQGSIDLRRIAREAKLVLTARLAQTSDYGPKNKVDRDVQEVYQRALNLLQDPMLPVRAHGLLLLRELLSSSRAEDQVTSALVPSILSIFLQSVQDDDSYIFLNGVQGLANLADKFGKEILRGLVRDYVGNLKGLGARNVTSHDIEVRTRIGEAISSVIKRCGSALGLYVDLLVPPLLTVIGNTDIPTVLRTSSISLLADCMETWPLALLPYIQDLCFGFIDLLQVEAKNILRHKKAAGSSSSTPATMNSDQTLKDSEIPALRRSAIYFLGSYIRATTKLIYDEGNLNVTIMIPNSLVQKADITLNYISSTDDDNRVRVMAKEAGENLEDLKRAVLGLS